MGSLDRTTWRMADRRSLNVDRARLLEAIRLERSRRNRRRFVFPAAAAVAIIASIAIGVSVIGPFAGGVAAATELRRLATIARSRSAPDVGAGEYLLVVSDELRR